MEANQERHMSPPQVGKLLGIAADKVVRLIRSGQLEGYDCAENPNGQRPRFRVTPEALEDFIARRAAVPTRPPSRRKRPATPKEFVRNFR